MLVKLDTNGKLEWKKEIGNNSYEKFVGWDVKETKDKGFITTGEIRRQSSRYYDLFILKVNKDGILVGVKDEEKTIPTQFYLKQNYPNPFNPTTILEVSIAETGFFSLDVYNSLGEKVTNIVSKNLDRGVHKYTFDASNLSSGVYFYRLTGNNVNLIKKMVLIR